MVANSGLGRRGKDRGRQLGSHFQARRQRDATNRAGLLIVLPTGANHIATHHGFNRQRAQTFDDDSAAAHLVTFIGRNDGFRVDAGQLIGNDVAELLKPEIGDGGQHFTFARNRVRQDDVESRKAIGGDDQQLFSVDGVNVAHLALGDQRQAGDGGFKKRSGHDRVPDEQKRHYKSVCAGFFGGEFLANAMGAPGNQSGDDRNRNASDYIGIHVVDFLGRLGQVLHQL